MKNSLVKFLDFESREHNPSVQVGTQPVVIQRDSELMEDMCRSELSVCTPLTETPANAGQPYDCNSRENLHLLLITDDMSFINSQIQLLRKRGIKAVHLPSIYDMQNILPFLLINDHSILIIKNPRKDVLGMLKQIIRTGQFNAYTPRMLAKRGGEPGNHMAAAKLRRAEEKAVEEKLASN